MKWQHIVIIGSGNLAEALAHAVVQKGMSLTIAARNVAKARLIADHCHRCGEDESEVQVCELVAIPANADLYILAVSDRAIGEVAHSLPLVAGSILLHTSGATPIEALPTHLRRGVLYPLQTFTAGREVDFSQIPLFIEGCDAECEELIRDFASTVSRHVAHADSEQRRRLHLAAVFACNFANHMFSIGEHIAHTAGFGFELLIPLICQTTKNATNSPSPRNIQTGPAVRGDVASQQRHLELLADDERLSEIYKLISENIWETSKKI